MKYLIAFIVFSVLILFHEFGHFLVAKMNGVDVEEFSLGFGPRILSFERGGTRYSFKLLLFGGSCQMKGMYAEYDGEEEEGQTVVEERRVEEGSFESVSVGRRAAIIFAGPLFNFLLAFICAIIVISVVGYDPAEVMSVAEGSPAAESGLQAGDTITHFMNYDVTIGRDVDAWFIFHDLNPGEEVTLRYRRDGEEREARFTPEVLTRYMLGMTYSLDDATAVISAVQEGSPLANIDVEPGDVITGINGETITTAKSLNEYFEAHPMDGSEVTLTYLHEGLSYEKTLTPVERKNAVLGFSYNLGREKTSALGVLKYSANEIVYWIKTVLRSLGSLFTGRFGVNELSGPVGIVDVVGTTYEETKSEGALMALMNILNLVILLSANLGVMNLLPIPAIDGGRLLFLFVEGIMRKPLNKKLQAALQTVAVVLLMLLMVYVMYNDTTRLMAP